MPNVEFIEHDPKNFPKNSRVMPWVKTGTRWQRRAIGAVIEIRTVTFGDEEPYTAIDILTQSDMIRTYRFDRPDRIRFSRA